MEIELRKWSMDLKDELIRICNRAERKYLSERMPEPYKESDAEWWINMVLDSDEKKGIFRAIIVDGVVAGNITIEQYDDVCRKDAEIGYFILPEYYSKGIMTEATKKICEIAFEKLDIVRLTGTVYSSNEASKKVLMKNGFEYEGSKRKAIFKDDKFCDLLIFGKLK